MNSDDEQEIIESIFCLKYLKDIFEEISLVRIELQKIYDEMSMTTDEDILKNNLKMAKRMLDNSGNG